MPAKLELLAANGCDTVGAVERCVNDTVFYMSCVDEALNDPAFGELGAALKADSAQRAFECAHTLKGVMVNLGLTPLYDRVNVLVEPLRVGSTDGLLPAYRELIAERDRLRALLGSV